MAANDAVILGYVYSTASLLDVPLDAARAQRVVSHLQRTAAMAALLESAPLAPHDELAETYCPAAFPALKNKRKRT